MEMISIPVCICRDIVNLYLDRRIYFTSENGITNPRVVNLGLPQGSCLSPILYIIYTRDLEHVLPSHTKLLQFADDICIYVKDKSIDNSLKLLEESIAALLKWTSTNNLNISENKSHICTFTRSRYNPPNYLNFNHKRFPYRNSVKFLGMHLDKKLTWKEHINSIIKRVEKSMNLIKTFSSQKWGADHNITLHMYKTLIRPIFDYGCVLYGNASNTHLKKLDTLHNQSLRMCVGFLRSTPTNVIYAETVEWPLEYRRKFLSDNLLVDLYSKRSKCVDLIGLLTALCYTTSYWKNKKIPMLVKSFSDHNKLLDIIYCNYYLPYFQLDLHAITKPVEIQESTYHELHPALRNKVFNWDLNCKWSGYTQIFTDGSKLNGVGGAFYCHTTREYHQFKLPDISSVFTAELYAIEKAFLFCLHSDNTRFVIFSDSKSSLDSLRLHSSRIFQINHLVSQILNYHRLLIENGKKVELVWIKGHAGIEGNEVVDKLAKEAVEMGEEQLDFKIPKRDLKSHFRSVLVEEWQTEFECSDKGVFYKELQPTLPRRPWFVGEKDRRFIQTISRLRSNHGLYKAHMYRIGLAETPMCEVCEEMEDMQHITLECVMNWDQLVLFIDNLVNLRVSLPINWKHLLAMNRIDVYKAIFNYLKMLHQNI